MITPEQYDSWPDALVELAQKLEDEIISDICRRLAKEKRITSTALIQTRSLINYSGLEVDEILRRVAEFSGVAIDDIYELYQDVLNQIVADERYVYEYLNKPTALKDNQYAQGLLQSQAMQTESEFRNLTKSLGFLMGKKQWVPIAQAYQNTLDYAVMQIQSGGIDPNTAIKKAIIRLTNSGLRTIDYASGHSDQIDVAVRRAVVTGMHQLSGKLEEIQAAELGTSLFEVSAHAGARDKGEGFINHKGWQGKVYWLGTPVAGYESLVEKTGYGDVAGLEGANCRHSKHVFVDGVSIRMLTEKELANIDQPDFIFEGKKYTAYDATQEQRGIERAIRFYKTRLGGLTSAGFGKGDKTYDQTKALISKWSQKYTAFSKAAGLRTQPERARVVKASA